MTILIFLIILGVLVFVHELGHFLAAKKARVQVDEFGFGYPPKAVILGEVWGTPITLNWIPFGGFVKIVGEDYEDETAENGSLRSQDATHISLQEHSQSSLKEGRTFTQVSKKWQAGILAAGIIFNILFAWFLFSLGFIIGVPSPAENDFGVAVKNPVLTITEIISSSPAQKAGLKTGDKLLNFLTPENVSDFINRSSGQVNLQIDRGGKILDFKITPETGIAKDKKVIGIGMDMVGTLYLPVYKAIYEGGRTTLRLSYLTVESIAGLIKDAVRGRADISEVSGPIGIIGLVGDASRLGFSYLLTFTALISINLAIINLVPFPALDGGRILFVAIEGITKRKISHKIAHTLNTIGFALLIILMLVVTYRDILKLF
jgi:regulator of sigma E protease